MSVDVEVGETGPVGGMEQLSSVRERDQHVGLCWTASAFVTIFLGYGFVERRHAAAGFLELRPQLLEGREILLPERREPLQDIGREGAPGSLWPSPRVAQADHGLPRPPRWPRRSVLGSDVRWVIAPSSAGAHKHVVEVHSLRRTGDAHAAALSLPAPGAVARRRLAGFVAIGQDDHVAHGFGRSRVRSPEVESAAHAGCRWPAWRRGRSRCPHRSSAPCRRPSRTAPPRHGPSIIFCGLSGALSDHHGKGRCGGSQASAVLAARHQPYHGGPVATGRVLQAGMEAERVGGRQVQAARAR